MQSAVEPLKDWAGTQHRPAPADCRIVSLVPSLTELLFALGLDAQVVGRTGFCTHPKPAVRRVPKVGGTKDFDVDRIRALAPTHLVVNVDENPKERVDQIAGFVPAIIVTHPMGPLDNPPLFRLFGGIFNRRREADALASRFDEAWRAALAATAGLPRERVLYLIWKDPWMTIARDTYIARALAAVGWDQIELPGDDRYPVVDLESALANTDRVLLSSEPYAFRQRDVDAVTQVAHALSAVPGHALAAGAVSLIDAEMTSWYGSRAIAGMRYLAALRAGGRA
jgi:ABC-type Fe3+-hydroxamate transport system substrate-binding protein